MKEQTPQLGIFSSIEGAPNSVLNKKLQETIWVAHSLFERGKTSGSSANISFREGNRIYISRSGSCFGTLTEEDFVGFDIPAAGTSPEMNPENNPTPIKPSKEWPLHLAMYEKSEKIQAVIHTHSLYSILWSTVPGLNPVNCVPDHTPYLRMKVGSVGLVPYEQPGTEELFAAFRESLPKSDGFLLKQHGPVIGGKSMMDAFYCLEELEESCHIAWELRNTGIAPGIE